MYENSVQPDQPASDDLLIYFYNFCHLRFMSASSLSFMLRSLSLISDCLLVTLESNLSVC